MEELQSNVASITVSANILWVLIAGFLVFFMQAGFALVEVGFTRAKNVAHTMMQRMFKRFLGILTADTDGSDAAISIGLLQGRPQRHTHPRD